MFWIFYFKARGIWVTQSVKRPMSCSGHDLMACEFEPHFGLCVLTAQSLEPASDSVSVFLAPPPLVLCLSEINIKKFSKILFK